MLGIYIAWILWGRVMGEKIMDRRELLIKELKRIDDYLQGIEQSISNINGKQEKEKEKDDTYQYSESHR